MCQTHRMNATTANFWCNIYTNAYHLLLLYWPLSIMHRPLALKKKKKKEEETANEWERVTKKKEERDRDKDKMG